FSRNPYRIEIDTSEHRLEVWRGDERWLETTVAIGTGTTPTPIGQFYIIELLQPPDSTGLYGPFAFGLSGFSETLQSFAGGDGVIGIHGTDEPDALGTDVSHGCVRVHNDVITELAGVIPLGTPVTITR
ncbi:MAG: L,D-transpeptidase, partial [Actinomycetota bacterium]